MNRILLAMSQTPGSRKISQCMLPLHRIWILILGNWKVISIRYKKSWKCASENELAIYALANKYSVHVYMYAVCNKLQIKPSFCSITKGKLFRQMRRLIPVLLVDDVYSRNSAIASFSLPPPAPSPFGVLFSPSHSQTYQARVLIYGFSVADSKRRGGWMNGAECFNLRFDAFGRLSKANVGNSGSGLWLFEGRKAATGTASSYCGCEKRTKQIALLVTICDNQQPIQKRFPFAAC